jgi:hypothetical protein
MQKNSIISQIRNFNRHILIDPFYFLTRNTNKRKAFELSLQEITIRSDNMLTMQCYDTVTEL